jgi:hypothetical protein
MKPTLDIILFVAALIVVALLADAWRSARHDSQQLAATLAAIQAQKRSVHTPQEAAKQLPTVLPDLPLPVSIHDPNLTAPLPPGEPATTTISIPQPDLVPLYDGLQDCRACALQGDSLKKDLADEKSRSASLQHERDAAIAAARGGTFFVRLKRAAKWFAVGLATGAAVAAVAHH